jgi:hypothetical protein
MRIGEIESFRAELSGGTEELAEALFPRFRKKSAKSFLLP